MYHMEDIDISPEDKEFAYSDTASLCANNMYNVTNFYTRNLMTGLKKKEGERTPNEKEVIKTVEEAIPAVNKKLQATYRKKVQKIKSNKSLTKKEQEEKVSKIKCAEFTMPTADKWFAGYNLLDAVFKQTENPDYRSHHSHVMQNAISDCTEAWTSRFNKGEGGLPKYRKSGGRSTAVFSNTACKIENGILAFPYATVKGKKERLFMDVSKLPHASKDKLIEVRIVPCRGAYQIQIITDDGINEDDIIPKEENIVSDNGAKGVMMLDPGLNNFATITDNKGGTPIVIKGGAIKARNQWYNKQMAGLRSKQMKGHNPKTYHPETTRRMKSLSRKRDAFMTDTFYKYAHFICRTMTERGLSYLIVGHNKGQKQNINMGKTNQAFVAVPFSRFNTILSSTARQYGICVILQEESYTSKACFAAKDFIPTYGQEDAEKAVFSGKRTHRGLYRQNDGKVINADVNGSANIGRKYNEEVFADVKDIGYLYKTVKAMTYRDILDVSHKYTTKK